MHTDYEEGSKIVVASYSLLTHYDICSLSSKTLEALTVVYMPRIILMELLALNRMKKVSIIIYQ